MPKTKLGNMVERDILIKKKKDETRKRKASEKIVSLTTKDYKRFCDEVFQTWVRYRDKWTCTITGKRFKEGDFEHYHACHFVSRNFLATRYLPDNCHGQSSWCNYQQHLGNALFVKQYIDFMSARYGSCKIEELKGLSACISKWGVDGWRDKASELYKKMVSDYHNGGGIIETRLSKVYKTVAEKRVLELILSEIK